MNGLKRIRRQTAHRIKYTASPHQTHAAQGVRTDVTSNILCIADRNARQWQKHGGDVLAKQLGLELVDTDGLIEAQENQTLQQIM